MRMRTDNETKTETDGVRDRDRKRKSVFSVQGRGGEVMKRRWRERTAASVQHFSLKITATE